MNYLVASFGEEEGHDGDVSSMANSGDDGASMDLEFEEL